MSNHRVIIILLSVIVSTALLSACGSSSTNANIQPVNTTNATTTNSASNTNVKTDVTVTGQVFVKSYGTPSESYGILLTSGDEVGMGSYDSMKEQLRPYIGDKITVTFTSVCDPQYASCCRTVFSRCGFVKTWSPIVKK